MIWKIAVTNQSNAASFTATSAPSSSSLWRRPFEIVVTYFPVRSHLRFIRPSPQSSFTNRSALSDRQSVPSSWTATYWSPARSVMRSQPSTQRIFVFKSFSRPSFSVLLWCGSPPYQSWYQASQSGPTKTGSLWRVSDSGKRLSSFLRRTIDFFVSSRQTFCAWLLHRSFSVTLSYGFCTISSNIPSFNFVRNTLRIASSISSSDKRPYSNASRAASSTTGIGSDIASTPAFTDAASDCACVPK